MDRNSYEALHNRAAWIDLTGRGKIRATGDDRVRLMHAMSTGNIEELIPGAGCYVFFLTAQGRILADANIFAMTDYLLLDTEPEAKQRLFEHLEKFIIADDVQLRDFTNDYVSINVEGPQAKERLQAMGVPVAQLPCSIAEWAQCSIAHVTYTGQAGYSIFAPCEQLGEIKSKLTDGGIPEADLATAEIVRIENGRPRYGIDILETNIPQETQQMHAVHPAKGCYIGQEIVERVRSRGHVNKQISALDIESTDAPPPGTKIYAETKEVGEVTSAAFSPARNKVVALGIVRGEALNAPLTVAGARAAVRPTKT